MWNRKFGKGIVCIALSAAMVVTICSQTVLSTTMGTDDSLAGMSQTLEEYCENKENGTAVMTKEKEVVYAKSGSEYKIEGTTANTIANEEANKVPSGYTTDDPILTDKDDISETGVKVDYNYMVKPFIYYSEEYKKDGNYDIVASYTLDNYVTL